MLKKNKTLKLKKQGNKLVVNFTALEYIGWASFDIFT